MRSPRSPGWTIFGVLSVVFMLSPLVLVVLMSFGSNEHATFPLGSLTLDWYRTLLSKPDFYVAASNSVTITAWVGGLSLVIGTAAAFALAQLRSGTVNLGLAVLLLPLMLPPLVLALALATSFSALGMRLGVITVILSQLVFTQPFVIIIVHARMRAFPVQLLESARDLGAGPVRIFFTVTLPVIRSSLIGAALIAMALSLDDFIITYFVSGSTVTYPLYVNAAVKAAVPPQINVLATAILVVSLVLLALGTLYRRKRIDVS